MKNHLVPEQRTDKNGVTTTRWVRPDSAGSTARSLPAPTVPANASAETRLVYTALELFKDELVGDGVENVQFLGKNSPQLLEEILEQSTDEAIKTLWLRRLTSGRIAAPHFSEETIDQKMQAIKDRVLVFPVATDLIRSLGEYGNPYLLTSHVGSVYSHVDVLLRHGVEKDVDHAPETIQSVAVISVIRGVHSPAHWRMNNTNVLFSSIEEDARYVSEHFDEVMMIVPELVERKSHDAGLMRSIIESDAPALGNGAL